MQKLQGDVPKSLDAAGSCQWLGRQWLAFALQTGKNQSNHHPKHATHVKWSGTSNCKSNQQAGDGQLEVCHGRILMEVLMGYEWATVVRAGARSISTNPTVILSIYRRKFRSQTSDNMDRWTAEMGRVREEKRRRKKIKKESFRRKKIQVREKVGQSRNTVFFQWFVAPKGRKVGSLKRRVGSQLARWEMKNCTPLWPKAHSQVKTPHARSTFWSWDVEKAHRVVARSTFRSQNV